jgi:hypothetical protein
MRNYEKWHTGCSLFRFNVLQISFIANFFFKTMYNFIYANVKGFVKVGIRCADHATPFIRKSWH